LGRKKKRTTRTNQPLPCRGSPPHTWRYNPDVRDAEYIRDVQKHTRHTHQIGCRVQPRGWACWPADHPKTNPYPFICHAVHLSSSFAALCAVRSSPTFVQLCTHAYIRCALHSSLAFATVALCTHRTHSPRHALIAFMHSPRCALINSSLSFVTLCTHRLHSPRCALIASIRHAMRSSLSFPALCTHSLGVLGSTLTISYPDVYNMYAPYHKRGLMARAFLFFDGQVQSLAHTHVGSSPIVDPFFLDKFLAFCFFRHAPRCALIASIRHAVHSSPPFATPCAHRFHSPRCALTPSLHQILRKAPPTKA
jgi:hypothetical protein